MKGKIIRTVGIALCLSCLLSTNAFAEWRQEDGNWRFANADGTYANSGWSWIDGKCYYFTPAGYCLINTITPDGYTVDGSGAWVVNGVVQVQAQQTQANAYAQSQETEEHSYAYGVLELVNTERQKNGRSKLAWDEGLAACAQVRAYEIAEYFSHTRPGGTSCFTILEDAGISYSTAGENIAAGQRTPGEVMNSWMNSAGHRENILKSAFGHIGVGCAYVNGSLYWVQMFTN